MNTSGLVIALFGVVLVAQVVKGGALQRLGIVGCPSGSSSSKQPAPSTPPTPSTPAPTVPSLPGAPIPKVLSL
ncbi:MAG: hypothetical protein JWP34_4562 [Massilia sp.]|nr:hypothetical protein [Gemmatimonadales bacterium]MDB5910448.1 hypothetical protein [Massilia sp.]